MGKNDAGKGSDKRPCLISREEETLRWNLARSEITYEEFIEAMIKKDENEQANRF